LAEVTLPADRGVREHPAIMTGAIGVLGVLGGALLFRSARKRLSAHWLIMIVVVGALSGLLLGRAATFPPGGHTEFLQRIAIAIVVTAWWLLIREILRDRANRQRGDGR
jgi:hypothetical protein